MWWSVAGGVVDGSINPLFNDPTLIWEKNNAADGIWFGPSSGPELVSTAVRVCVREKLIYYRSVDMCEGFVSQGQYVCFRMLEKTVFIKLLVKECTVMVY